MDTANSDSLSGICESQLFSSTIAQRQLKFSDEHWRPIEKRCAKWMLPPTHYTQFTIDTIFLVPTACNNCVNRLFSTDRSSVYGHWQVFGY